LFNGGYFGALIGHGSVNTRLTGPRGPRVNETSVIADFGNSGGTWGLLAGYGHAFDHWYLGVETEGQPSKTRWAFSREEDVRDFDIEKRLSYSAAVRLGYLAGNRVLYYGRLGWVRSEFMSRYIFGESYVDQDNTLDGLRYGGGIEVRNNSNVFFRLDYSRTAYDEYEVDYGSAIDTLKPKENLLWLGAGVGF
jgi:opacity protein-like surface antigen